MPGKGSTFTRYFAPAQALPKSAQGAEVNLSRCCAVGVGIGQCLHDDTALILKGFATAHPMDPSLSTSIATLFLADAAFDPFAALFLVLSMAFFPSPPLAVKLRATRVETIAAGTAGAQRHPAQGSQPAGRLPVRLASPLASLGLAAV